MRAQSRPSRPLLKGAVEPLNGSQFAEQLATQFGERRRRRAHGCGDDRGVRPILECIKAQRASDPVHGTADALKIHKPRLGGFARKYQSHMVVIAPHEANWLDPIEACNRCGEPRGQWRMRPKCVRESHYSELSASSALRGRVARSCAARCRDRPAAGAVPPPHGRHAGGGTPSLSIPFPQACRAPPRQARRCR